ncbi:MAG TPA: ABC transporter permease [Candidatus Kryptonia bacterium]
MIKNYLQVAIRNMSRRKMYSFINITGLAIGLAVTILILLFVNNESSFDKFNLNVSKIYRVNSEWKRNGEPILHSDQPVPLGPALVSEFPDIISSVRLYPGEAVVSHNGNYTREDVTFTDPDIFSVFSFPLLRGDPSSVLAQPNSVVLTEKKAREIFGGQDPVSKVLTINLDGKLDSYVVTGIAKDIPDNSSIDFGVLLPIISMPRYQSMRTDWTSFSGSTYLLLSGSTSIANIERNIPEFVSKHFGKFIAESQTNGWIDKSDNVFRLRFEPLSHVHFSGVKFQNERTGNPVYSYVLSVIALIIILIACVNFISLSLGQAAYRTKEVGVRKVLGAGQNDIMIQFWIESILLTAAAFLSSLFLVELLLPIANQISGKHFGISDLFSPAFIAVLIGLVFIVAMLAGSYPSIVLSDYRPAEVLKGKSRTRKTTVLSRSLVVGQFGLAVFLTACAIIVWSQLKYVQTRDLGYSGDQVVVVPFGWGHGDGLRMVSVFKNELSGHPGIIDVSCTSATFGNGYNRKVFRYDGKTHETYVYSADDRYISTLGLHLLEGRNFRAGSTADSMLSVIVNEEFVRELGWRLPVTGKKIPGWTWSGDDKEDLRIVGVIKDYNFLSLHDEIAPVVLTMNPEWGVSSMMIKIGKDNIPATISDIKRAFQNIVPDTPFEFTFLNQDVQKQYDDDLKEGEIVGTASVFAVFISCLGLFGLVLLAVSARTKEVGIRKVLGASVAGIVTIITGDFLKLVALSNLIALPIVFYVGTKWLRGFAYRISITPWIFILAAGATFAISIMTIAFLAVKAATKNPVEALRYE